ncbi:unnamed protein product [Hymenolepis diminuta]|uniref:Uncharacterized protein n=1 Tax=Hymenolepis diminuta TaxID=6216 RepID=A0A564YRI6_HYMDI|nr:unnamed protein product [Hymenolepis diminuta]
MFESLSTEIKILSAKIATKMSPDVSNASTTTASLNSKNSTQSPVIFVFPKILPTATLVLAPIMTGSCAH